MSGEGTTVLQVLEAWRQGGTEHYVRQIGVALRGAGICQHVAALRPGRGDLETDQTGGGVIHELADGPREPLEGLRQLIARLEPDVVHLHLYASMGRVLRRLRSVEIPRLGATFHFGVDRWRWYRRGGWRQAARVADFATATSRRSADSFGSLASRIEVVYPTLPPNLPATKAPADRDDPAPFRLLGCGRMSAEKDWGTLLRAVQILRRQKDVYCTLIGDGVLRGELQRLAASLGIDDSVRFLDNLPQAAVFDEMTRADLFVVPSRFEGFGMAAAEAMAIGVPTVVSTEVAAGELLTEIVPGNLGWPLRFPVGDWRGLADRLGWHHGHRADSWALARRIAPEVQRQLAPERTVARFASLYQGKATR